MKKPKVKIIKPKTNVRLIKRMRYIKLSAMFLKKSTDMMNARKIDMARLFITKARKYADLAKKFSAGE